MLDASERARRLRRFAPPEVFLNVGADERAVSVAKLAEVARLKRLGPFRLGRRVPITLDGLTAVAGSVGTNGVPTRSPNL